jgi:outer membrane protein assembly factor BamB
MTRRPALALIAALALLAGCDKDKDVDPPAELVDLKQVLPVQRLWSTGVGGGGEELRLALGLAEHDGVIFAAARDGKVQALDPGNGRNRWQVDLKVDLSAGPGAGEGLVAVGSPAGILFALDAATGQQRWKIQAGGEILAPPLVAAERVVVRLVDGRMRAFATADGKEVWMAEDQVPRLSLRGSSAPVQAGDAVIAGFDSGKVMAVGLASGDLLWQAQVSSARGRTELERLADVDAAVRVAGDDVFAVGYQGRVAMLARESGQIWWGRDLSSYRGLAIDDDQIYVATSEGDVVALRRRDGSILWQQQGLRRRSTGTPAVVGSAVVVGDFDGYLHWLDRSDGRFVARQRPGRDRISAAPLVVGNRVYVIDEGGQIAAFQSGDAAGR